MQPSFITSSATLLRGLERVKSAVGGTPDMPILGCILLELGGDKLELAATDLNIRLGYTLEDIEAPEDAAGRLAVPASKLLSLLSNMPAQPLTLTFDLDTFALDVKGSAGKYRLAGEDARLFPHAPDFEEVAEHRLPSGWLQRGLAKTVPYPLADAGARPSLGGVCIKFGEKALDFSASEGHGIMARYRQRRTENGAVDEQEVVVPVDSLKILASLLPKSLSVESCIVICKKHFIVSSENLLFSCRIIDAQFPALGQVLAATKKRNSNQVLVNKANLLGALRRLQIFVDDKTQAVTFGIAQSEGITLSARNIDGANAGEEFVIAECQASLIISLRLKNLLDVLGGLDGERVRLSVGTSDTHHCLITSGDPNEGEHLEILLGAVAA